MIRRTTSQLTSTVYANARWPFSSTNPEFDWQSQYVASTHTSQSQRTKKLSSTTWKPLGLGNYCHELSKHPGMARTYSSYTDSRYWKSSHKGGTSSSSISLKNDIGTALFDALFQRSSRSSRLFHRRQWDTGVDNWEQQTLFLWAVYPLFGLT